MVVWSLACASHGLATGFGMLAVSRFLLGMGEGGGFPAATKAVAEWFPARERSTAMGIINAGTAVGAVIAPPLIAFVLAHAELALGVLSSPARSGLLWTAWWLRRVSSARRHVEADSSRAAARPSDRLARPVPFPQVWGLVFAKFLSDAAWYFYLFWLPKYLYDVRGFDTKQVGYYAWIPYAASGIGSLCGGWFSSWLHPARPFARTSRASWRWASSAALMPLVVFVTSRRWRWRSCCSASRSAGQQSWSTLVMILPADLFPHRAVGSVAGLVGFGGRWAAWSSAWWSATCWITGSATASCSGSSARFTCWHFVSFSWPSELCGP